mgnify:CR=1 FL=1
MDTKEAKAVHGFKSVIVKDCPFCHGKHVHSETTAEGEIRTSDCLIGFYIITFKL